MNECLRHMGLYMNKEPSAMANRNGCFIGMCHNDKQGDCLTVCKV
ncbi:MAG TPA: hypothetical protein PLA96_06055 [Candidatus Brocadia sapporoensis]|nr:hypothetical protein [Candidatus Brocadia sapporoensis]HQU31047.1 hypothetical protein [Candidatus Brocadia sapporoensis]